MSRSMQELKRLNHKFDFTNPPGPQFNVSFDVLVANDIPLDPTLDCRNFIQQITSRTLRINKRLMLAEEFVSELATSADATCFYERKALPCFAKTGIVILHALERTCQRPGSSFRAKTQINPKESSI